MKLKTYLESHKLTKVSFAEQIGVQRQAIHDWCKGTIPDPVNMPKVVQATGGLVTANDFYDITPPTPKKKRGTNG